MSAPAVQLGPGEGEAGGDGGGGRGPYRQPDVAGQAVCGQTDSDFCLSVWCVARERGVLNSMTMLFVPARQRTQQCGYEASAHG